MKKYRQYFLFERITAVFFLGCLLFFTGAVTAQDSSDISVEAKVDNAVITIGSRINYTVLIRHKPEIKVTSKITSEHLSDFEIKDIKDIEPYDEDGILVEGRNFVITAYSLGEYVIQGQTIKYLTPENEEKTISTNDIYIKVETVDATRTAESDIRGIKGVVALEKNYWPLITVIAVLVLAALIYLFIRARKKKIEEKITEKVLLSPHEEAYQALNRLKESDLLKQGRIKEFYIAVSEIIRRYIERRYEVPAVEMTTYEIRQSLKQQKIDDEIRRIISLFLAECDLVKFAKYRPEAMEILKTHEQGVKIVDSTKKEEPLIDETEENTKKEE